MSKVFRIHNTGSSSADWFTSVEIGASIIDEIHAEDKKGTKQPTSIPSPFARLDLVRTAFEKVARKGDLDGDGDQHKLISDAFDIGQILFNYSKHNDELDLIKWEKEAALSGLENSSKKHKHLGDTLKLFLEQDATQNNFKDLNSFFILKYRGTVIGGTSPNTLFFASSASETVDVKIKFGKDVMLDDKILPLYKRERNYIKYIFSIAKTPNFANLFSEFNKYLSESLKKINETDYPFYRELENLTLEDYNHLSDFSFPNNQGINVEVLNGIPLKEFKTNPKDILDNSDFVIKTKKEVDGFLPLVLPNDAFMLRWKYTTDNWDSKVKAEDKNNTALNKRKLPGQGDVYPYLSASDFLTDTIIKLPYEINDRKFYTLGEGNEKQFLLPLTELFFDYFTIDDIKDMLSFETRGIGDTLKVKLKIPTKKGEIVYERLYHKSESIETKYTIKSIGFALALFPFVKDLNCENSINYNVFVGASSHRGQVQLSFLNSLNNHITKDENVKDRISIGEEKINVHSFSNGFDAIMINVGEVTNVLQPLFKTKVKSHEYSFGIDLGTTNTHVAYRKENGEVYNFDVQDSDTSIAYLLDAEDASKARDSETQQYASLLGYINQTSIPKFFNYSDSIYSFPLRTCLLENKEIDFVQSVSLFKDANIGFDYEKLNIIDGVIPNTNIKWGAIDGNNQKRIELFINELLLLCKSKVLMNDGNLKKTKISWTYPVSMQTHRLTSISNIWKAGFIKHFKGADLKNLSMLPESVTPFFYMINKENLSYLERPTVSVDIGGGTSDIAIFDKGITKLISSFKFAGNSLYGDGFNGSKSNNGFIKAYDDKVRELINADTKKSANLNRVLKDVENNSVDLISFYFSIVKGNDEQNWFSKELSNNVNFKIVYALFYSTIAYHIAQLVKKNKLDKPENIIFSGTASKSLSILDNSSNCEFVETMFNYIFNQVLGENEAKLSLKIVEEPKEITAKGLLFGNEISATEIKKLKAFLIGDRDLTQVDCENTSITLGEGGETAKNKIVDGVIDNVKEFYSIFDGMVSSLDLKDNIGVTEESLNLLNELKHQNIKHNILEGINKNAEKGDFEKVNETLFFYAFIGVIPQLVYKLSEQVTAEN